MMNNNLQMAVATFQALRVRILALDPTLDEATLADTVEGLTDLHEILAAIIRSALTDEALANGLKHRIEEMHARLERLEDRAAKSRLLARDVMSEMDIKKIAAADFSVSVRPGSPSLTVTNEAEIPAPFWEAREPRLNRHALLAELKSGSVIAGVALSNPEPVLTVRTK